MQSFRGQEETLGKFPSQISIFELVAYVIIDHPIHIGIQADIIVILLPSNAHIGEEIGAATTATRGTMLPKVIKSL